MDVNSSASNNCDNIDWDTEDDLEIENFTSSSSYNPTLPNGQPRASSTEASSSPGSSGLKLADHFVTMGFPEEMVYRVIQENGEGDSDLILEALLRYSDAAPAAAGASDSKSFDHFIRMGFSEKMVTKAIKKNGEENMDLILETLLTYSALQESPEEQKQVSSDSCSEYEQSLLNDFSDTDSWSSDEESTNPVNFEDNKVLFLVKMGYRAEEVSLAIQRCGPDSTIIELTDCICAAQISREEDALLPLEEPRSFRYLSKYKKRKQIHDVLLRKKKVSGENLNEDEEPVRLPNPMIGFGVPNEPGHLTYRKLPEAAMGPPYFYYENVALAPKGVWTDISRYLYEVEPEFVDSKYFCAAARKRGYVHNLPIQNRYPLLPLPAFTVNEAFPLTKKWWPSWDSRTKLNCLQTCVGSAKLTDRIRKALEAYDGVPPAEVQKFVVEQCRKWNLVWVGRNKVAPLEPDEVEMLLGFPKNHTRGGGISRTDRYKSLGNSFQVDTVAYHLSVVKAMFPGGINLLSLFSGIGGAEVALHRIGVRLKTVVSVEISEGNRNIVSSWWEQTGQRGNLIDIADVQHLTNERLEQLMMEYGSFDLVVGGSPCNNLAGSNRHHRDGLIGDHSKLFFDYVRILDFIKCMATRNR